MREPTLSLRSLCVFVVASLGFSAALLSCQKRSPIENATGLAYSGILDSAVGSLNLVLNDAERVNTIPSETTCTAARFSPALGTATCVGTVGGRTIDITYNCAALASTDVSLSGAANLTFNVATTCNDWVSTGVPGSGSVVWTSSNFSRSGTGGAVSSSSALHTNYLGTSLGGGATISYLGGPTSAMTVAFGGLRRRGSVSGLSIDHSVRTATGSAIGISGTLAAANRAIPSGTIIIDDNNADYTATITMTAVSWGTASCCYPTSGALSIALGGSVTGTATASFATGTCGRVNVTTATGTTGTVTLQSCE